MQYRSMAKRYILERIYNFVVTEEDGERLSPTGEPFTARQLDKFISAVIAEAGAIERRYKKTPRR